MNYTTKSHPTQYHGVIFRSRLEARWAAFFDLIGWKWEYEPIDLDGWTPDFRVEFPCYHSECNGTHALLIEVKPYFSIDDFKNHPCTKHFWGRDIPADSSAAFGCNPSVVYWEMVHGAGGGSEEGIQAFENWKVFNMDVRYAWNVAGYVTQYKSPSIFEVSICGVNG